jgi:Arc/MetJ-type ribon-helix-helix transcriptional regulator
MKITLSAELEQRVEAIVNQGRYKNADEFFAAAAALLLEVQNDFGAPIPFGESWEKQVAFLLQEGEDSGEYTDMTQADWDDIRREGTALIKAKKPA